MKGPNKVALVTGASSGFGYEIARLLCASGWIVYGTSRKPGSVSSRPTLEGAGIRLLALDVTKPMSIERCIDTIVGEHGRIDALVNNAGYGLKGAIEETSIETARALFETNFFGVAAVTRAVVPHMRERGGRIVNMSSLSGLVGSPFAGYYTATKHALEGYRETLSMELSRFGIAVVIVEPSYFKTDITKGYAYADESLGAYDDVRSAAYEESTRSIEHGEDPRLVARCVLRALSVSRPKLRYRVGRLARWVPRLRTFLPRFIRRMTMKKFGLS